MLHTRRARWYLWIVVVLGGLASCHKKEEPAPRTRTEIFKQGLELPGVYLTEKTHKRVIAPTRFGLPFVDPESGETCWPALYCTNPDCPGRREGEPLLFIKTDANYACPHCIAKRKLAAETEAVRQQYANWVRPYVLPETAEKLKQLDAERQKRIAKERTRRLAPVILNKPPAISTGGPQPTKADPASRPPKE